MDLLAPLARAFNEQQVRYVVIGVGGANYWAHAAGVVFLTHDHDLFLPPDSENLVAAWSACETAGFEKRERPRAAQSTVCPGAWPHVNPSDGRFNVTIRTRWSAALRPGAPLMMTWSPAFNVSRVTPCCPSWPTPPHSTA